jgi:hypothetical protein
MKHSNIYQIAYFTFGLVGPKTYFLDRRLFEICPFQFQELCWARKIMDSSNNLLDGWVDFQGR